MRAFYKTSTRSSLQLLILIWLIGGITAITRAAVVNATFNSAADIPVTASSYTATGNTINLKLNFVPTTGTTLTVVNNTGLPFINGTFTNLPQGQAVTLPYNGANYKFVANYFGGTGNDLVLLWATNRLLSWGNDTIGQLGNGLTTTSLVATSVVTSGALAGKTISKIATGSSTTLALCSDGSLVAWGSNSSGQFGDGTTTSSAVPVLINKTGALAGKTITAIAVGSTHSLALCSDGTVAAWGGNVSGQLGNNSTTSSTVPVSVQTTGTALQGKNVTAISAGSGFSVVLCSDGTVASWGNNSSGRLGNGSTTLSLVAVQVITTGTALQGKTVTAIAAGESFTLALCSDGTVASWGGNLNGQLGNNSSTASSVAVAVATSGTALAGKTVKAIAAGTFSTSLALCTDGTIASWGGDTSGSLGKGTTFGFSIVPVQVIANGALAGKTVLSISAGTAFNIARCSDGTLVAWGDNSAGELGNNNLLNSGAPVAVTTLATALQGKTVTTVSAGGAFGVAVCSDGSVAAWGSNTLGQLGTNGPTLFTSPGQVINTGILANKTIVSAAAGSRHSLILCSDGTLASTGYNGNGQLGTVTTASRTEPWPVYTSGALAGKTVVAIAAGQFHSLALCSDGSIAAWGYNASGQLGNNSLADSLVPVAVNTTGALAGKSVVAISAGQDFSLALCSDGTLVTWGAGGDGELGNGTYGQSKVPVLVTTTGVLSGQTVVGIAASTFHCLALLADGTVAAWGGNGNGSLGNGSLSNSNVPISVTTIGTALESKFVTKIAAGNSRSLALCSDGTLAAWGFQNVGNGTSTSINLPVLVSNSGVLAGLTVQTMVSGVSQSLALCTDGTLGAWGSGSSGNAGVSSTTALAVSTAAFDPGERFVAPFTSPNAGHTLAVVATPVPDVTTLAATTITGSSAILNGSVTAAIYPADVSFDLGPSTAYGTSIIGAPATIPPGAATAVTATLTGLLPGTTYHFRLKATNGAGDGSGTDLSFTTTPNSVATLASLGLSSGALSPAFSGANLAYTADVLTSVSSITVTPVTSDTYATVQVKAGSGTYATVTSGSPSGSLAITPNATTSVSVKVTAQDGVTSNTYVIDVISRTAFASWQHNHFGNAVNRIGFTEDYDGDGINNGTEFAFGTHPANASVGHRELSHAGNVITPGMPCIERNGNMPSAVFVRRTDYVSSKLTYTVQFSTKLSDWETDTRTPTLIATDGINDVVGLTFPKLSSGYQAKFFRVTVTTAP